MAANFQETDGVLIRIKHLQYFNQQTFLFMLQFCYISRSKGQFQGQT